MRLLLKFTMTAIRSGQEKDQLPLPFARDEKMLEADLRHMTGQDLVLILTDNSTTMISLRKKAATVTVRVQRMFLRAPRDVIDEIAQFIGGRTARTPLLQRFIRENCRDIERRPHRTQLKAAGRYHDLLAYYESVNREYFEGRVQAVITWGVRSPRYGARRRTLGSFSSESKIIRINPALDRRNVPSFFVRFIVYHEMLHADIGVEMKGARRSVHSREFRRRERLFREYERAVAWERK
jgi:predicted metal-dependent hydrolase